MQLQINNSLMEKKYNKDVKDLKDVIDYLVRNFESFEAKFSNYEMN